MAGIVGIENSGKQDQVARMLARVAHRGASGSKIIESHGATLGAVWPEAEAEPTPAMLRKQAAWDAEQPPLPDPAALRQKRGPFALTAATPHGVFLARDPLGIRPLYYGRTDEGDLCFGSEAKALVGMTDHIHDFPPGTWYESREGFQTFFEMEPGPELGQNSDEIVAELRLQLEQAVSRRLDHELMGCWLAGGLDSSTLAALARPQVRALHTFAAGTPGSPDLALAQQVAEFLKTEHHEIMVTQDELLAALPRVIWHVESFDVPLVRSAMIRYLATKRAADFVETILFDDGANELFGGHDYLKEMEPENLPKELVHSAQSLHKTALQWVDRSASSQGLVAHVPFLDLDVFEYAMRIPPELKLRRNGETIGKWILRRAMSDALPQDVIHPHRASLWQGAGVAFLLALSAEDQITDQEFRRERTLPNGWTLSTKEELMYYRVFRDHFGELDDLSWMGGSKEAPAS